jgi:hypothetical protein
MIIVEYEFIKNSKGIASQFRVYYKGRIHSATYRSEFADKIEYSVVRDTVDGITIGWAVKPNFVTENAILSEPYKWNYTGKKWEKVDKKEGMSWLAAIRKKGGKIYGD